jgi:hypothetical protein
MPENNAAPRKKPARRGVRLLLAVLLALGAAVSVSAATQGSARAAACDPVNGQFPNGNCYNYVLSHVCEQISPSSNADQADICTDIYASWTAASYSSQGTLDIWGVGEYYCQGASVQCKGVNASNTLAVTGHPAGGGTTHASESSGTYMCSTTSCPNGGRVKWPTGHFTAPIASGVNEGTKSYTACYDLSSTIPSGNAILVSDTSTAYHPLYDFTRSRSNVCFASY